MTNTSEPEPHYHHGRHPWTQRGDMPDRVWLLRFDDRDQREMIWTGPDAEQEARAAYALYSPAWNCHLLATAEAFPLTPGGGQSEEGGKLAALREIKRLCLTMGAPGQITVPLGLARIVRLCINAGVTEKLDELDQQAPPQPAGQSDRERALVEALRPLVDELVRSRRPHGNVVTSVLPIDQMLETALAALAALAAYDTQPESKNHG